VPYTLLQQLVEVRSTPTTVEIFTKATGSFPTCAIAGEGQAVTRTNTVQESSSPSAMDAGEDGELGAQVIGPNTAQLSNES